MALLSALLTTGCSVVGIRSGTRFIFGGNQSGSNIAMTAPVGQDQLPPGQLQPGQSQPGQWRISFVMPKKYTSSSLPQPNDPAVHIVTAPGQTVAVYRYTGSIDPAATDAAERELLRLLQGSGWVASGHPVAWFYDPPWTVPFLRRNEAAVPVTKPG